METRQSGIVLGRIRTLFNEGRIGTMTDEQLLERFAARRALAAEAVEAAEVAFEVLVLRHGPMVLGVCRRVLRDPHEVEDAFQATFLILARRAGSIRKREVLGGWLRKVAHRVAARARALSVRRGALEPIHPVSLALEPGAIVEREDLCTAVLDEVQLLPEKYRLPVQLCYLEGQTHHEAARRLAWPVGTVRTRLAWARDRLRARLTRRGLVVPAGFIGTSLVSLKASAEVPASMAKATVEAATGHKVGAAANSLATHVLRAMLMSQLKLAILVVLVAGSLVGATLPLTRAQLGKAGPAVAERGTSIGGGVRDEDGRPIEGVTVTFRDSAPDDRSREGPDFNQITARTDPQGRWHIDFIATGIDLGRLHFTFSHPEFLSWVDAVNAQPSATPDQLRSRSGVIVLRRGTSLTGVVLARDGRPIAGASVELADHVSRPATTTDAGGRFRIGNAEARLTFLTAEAAGTAPEMKSLIVEPGLAPIEFRLGPGRTIRGRVIDSRGRPVTGAIISAFIWNGRQSLAWRTETDREGRFRRDHAAGDAVTVVASAPGFPPAELSVEPSEKEYVFKLRNFLSIMGTVTDAETGRAIETFSVVPGIQIGDPFPLWMFGRAKTHHGGHYDFRCDAPAPGVPLDSVRIEAKGYLPVVSPAHANDAGERVFDARLKKGEWMEGVVRGPDGAPLTGAEVILVTGRVFGGIVMGGGIHIGGGKTYQREYCPHVVTGTAGRFAFPAPEGPYALVALHDQGYAEATGQQLAESRGLTTQPWGRIEGTLRVGGKPLAHEIIVASVDQARIDPDWLSVQNESRARTDEHGRFVIERVAPGAASVYWRPANWDARTSGLRYDQPAFLDVVPGQTIRVDLTHDAGRPLVGRVVMPDAAGHRLDLAAISGYLLVKLPEVPFPPGRARQERQEWLSRWRNTKAAREYRYRQERRVANMLTFQPDGSFRIDEVQPGAYELQIRLPWFDDLIREVTVPEPAAGQDGAMVDVGALALKRSANPVLGR